MLSFISFLLLFYSSVLLIISVRIHFNFFNSEFTFWKLNFLHVRLHACQFSLKFRCPCPEKQLVRVRVRRRVRQGCQTQTQTFKFQTKFSNFWGVVLIGGFHKLRGFLTELPEFQRIDRNWSIIPRIYRAFSGFMLPKCKDFVISRKNGFRRDSVTSPKTSNDFAENMRIVILRELRVLRVHVREPFFDFFGNWRSVKLMPRPS